MPNMTLSRPVVAVAMEVDVVVVTKGVVSIPEARCGSSSSATIASERLPLSSSAKGKALVTLSLFVKDAGWFWGNFLI